MWGMPKYDPSVCDDCYAELSSETKNACYEVARILKLAVGDEWPAPLFEEIEKGVSGLAKAVVLEAVERLRICK